MAAELGVPAVVIGRTIRTLLAGEEVGSFEEGGERYDVRMQVLPEYRDDPERLDLIHVRGAGGELIPITNVARAAHRRRARCRSSARTARVASWSTPTPLPASRCRP